MQGWIVFWKCVLLTACVLYFGVALLVALKGAGDIKDLLGRRRE